MDSDAEKQVLVLPLDDTIFPDPSPVLPTIYRVLSSLPNSTAQFVVLFTSPSEGKQLYREIRSNSVAYWDEFQGFLGKVYASLAAAQWTSDRVLLDVEVGFVGEEGLDVHDGPVTVLEGYEHLAEIAGYKPTPSIIPCPRLDVKPLSITKPPQPIPRVSALGGTFDHLHAAHKLLLQLALFITSKKLIVGVMADHLLHSKSNATLVQPIDQRIKAIEAFLSRHGAYKPAVGNADTGGKVKMDVLEITDGYGPTAWDEDIQALVVSQETYTGGLAVNKLRKEKNLPELQMFVIDVIASTLETSDGQADVSGLEEDGQAPAEEKKQAEKEERVRVKIGEEVKTLDLSGEKDEKRLKELKMGSTAIRQWIADRKKG